ncbi:MAG: glutaredoxin 3 [Alphaproteobacteria bacterium]|nr:glutaredoxin 3 [Alphaproteobacteria bacterium]
MRASLKRIAQRLSANRGRRRDPAPPTATGTAAVTIYTTMFCPYCARAKRLLGRKGVAFEEIAVDGDRDRRAEMIARAAGRRTVPQIFIDGRHVGGADELADLERAGKLDALLATAP